MLTSHQLHSDVPRTFIISTLDPLLSADPKMAPSSTMKVLLVILAFTTLLAYLEAKPVAEPALPLVGLVAPAAAKVASSALAGIGFNVGSTVYNSLGNLGNTLGNLFG